MCLYKILDKYSNIVIRNFRYIVIKLICDMVTAAVFLAYQDAVITAATNPKIKTNNLDRDE